MSDGLLTAATLAVLAAHIVALAAAIAFRRGPGPVRALNLAVAAAVLAYLATRVAYIVRDPIDWQLVALALFEAVVVIVALTGWRRRRDRADWASYSLFAVHFLASIAAVVVTTTVRFDRMM